MTENPETPAVPEPAPSPASGPAPEPGTTRQAVAEAPAESTEEPTAETVAESTEEPAAEVTAADPVPDAPKRPRDRRRIAVVGGVGVLVVAVLAGITCTAVAVQGADRDAGAPVWRLPKAAKATKPAADSGLQGMLLPYDTLHQRGPDMAQFGSDVALSGEQTALMRKESIKDLPRSQRQRLERQIDRDPVKGMAMRSYLNNEASGSEYTVEIDLAQMGNQRTVRSVAAVQREFFDTLKALRKGPEIKGYKDSAACFLPVADSAEKLDMMFCTGYVGDVLITATAFAGKPLDKDDVASMLRAQFDRIKEPGASV
ncbi:hypothetical protein QZN11_15100 [Streptomyces gramineus]|uniref:hypothetical protein n=1 Tax=Streptomyces gramineus TaxID=910542 RepID=UPI00398AC766